MSKISKEPLMEYLTSRRTCSLGNLAEHFDCTFEEILPVVQDLKSENRLRFSLSSCQVGCDSCCGCESALSSIPMTVQTLAISLERREIEL